MKDELFKKSDTPIYETFTFNKDVVEVFDDMVQRSVPYYAQLQSLISQLALRYHQGLPIYDLGCSTGNTFSTIIQDSSEPLTLVGIDNSSDMLNSCRNKLSDAFQEHSIHLENADIENLEKLNYGQAGVVILCLVAQFIRPLKRTALLSTIYRNLASGGCLLIVEKTIQEDVILNSLYIDLYHSFKAKNGYSELEIAKKRTSLENRLIPFTQNENIDLLKKVGFQKVSIFFSWLNFQGYIALKGDESPKL